MQIAIGQLSQESNTFNPLPTARENFEQFGVARGADVVSEMADTNELGGFIQSLRAWPERPEIIGLARLMAWPSGMATNETFGWLRDELLAPLRRRMPVDAVLLSLHGAMVAEGVPDVEGEILRAVRELVGPRVPIVATLDLHANITALMVASADALVLFHTAPHIDVFETGRRGARLLRRILIEGAKPQTVFRKLPMVVPAEAANTQDPASVSYDFRLRLQALEQLPGVLAAGLAPVQPWLDIPELGTSVVLVADGRRDLAETHCHELAAEVWRRRREYLPELVPVEIAVRRAHERSDGLVVLSDSADATTSGAPGDSNWVLRELLKFSWPRAALVPMVAPGVVSAAEAAGIGAELTTLLGGVRDVKFSQPIQITAKVERFFDAHFILSGHLAKNLPIDMGRSAVLAAGDVRVLVTSRSGPHFAPRFFQAAGFDPFAASVLVAKSPCGFRAAYQERAREIMVVRAPGCAPSDFWNYEYRRIPRPLWPWDEIDHTERQTRRVGGV
ncbi:MAG TPA: M81 family metallopeptidase [Pirellulales bacterium]|nr:M81 family metallopeptidase [Pirellulales bacterium]